jgi:hypothetical protein
LKEEEEDLMGLTVLASLGSEKTEGLELRRCFEDFSSSLELEEAWERDLWDRCERWERVLCLDAELCLLMTEPSVSFLLL